MLSMAPRFQNARPQMARWMQQMQGRMTAPQIAPMGVPSRTVFGQQFWNDRAPLQQFQPQSGQGGGGQNGIGSAGDAGGQPGSAGRGAGKDAADALMGLGLGAVGLTGAGTIGGLASRGMLGPSFGPASPTNMDINPAAYGFNRDAGSGVASNSSPSEGYSQGDPSQGGGLTGVDAHAHEVSVGDTSVSGGAGGTGAGANDGSGPGGIGGQGSGSGGIGGVGGGAGDNGGIMHKGGIVPGRGNRDTRKEWLTPGEGVLTKQAVSMLHPHVIMMLNAMAAHRGR